METVWEEKEVGERGEIYEMLIIGSSDQM